jgi:starvation-inducible outer membrane lipoprotein
MKKTIFLIALAVLISGCTASPEVSDLLGYPGGSITEI